MAFESWEEAKAFVIRHTPDLIVKRRFNFITIHYLYLIGMTILISVIVFGIGGMAYIDALFFASGACTQSGLNTIDVNNISTGQQAVLFTASMLCNPIAINTFVVFVRLYWFERRFKDLVKDARSLRRTKSRSRNNTINREDPDGDRVERGVAGRAIRILRDTGHHEKQHDQDLKEKANGKPVDSSDTSRKSNDEKRHSGLPAHRLGRIETSSMDDVRMPQQLSPEQTIRFLENQRNPKDGEALRIPSPREFDRGGRPEAVNEDPEENLRLFRSVTTLEPVTSSGDIGPKDDVANGNPHIRIDEPQIMRSRDKTITFPRVNSRQTTQSRNQDLRPTRSRRRNTFSSMKRSNTVRSIEPAPYLSYQPTIGRNSFFVNLTEEQREELGGIEYRALKTLAVTLLVYFFGFHLFGIICLIPWIWKTTSYGDVVRQQGQGRTWWGIFTSGSAFNDLGFTLTNNSMISFGNAVFPLLVMSFLIVIGNTGFPCMLRFVIWVASKFVPFGGPLWEELRFLLDHPRRCFTLLFPRSATWWLLAILVILNGLDLIFFIILDLNDPTVSSLPAGIRFLDGLFQAFSTRTAGFAVVNLADLHPAIQVSYLIMMYISVFPIAISMRRTNVYEEKSLGIYANAEEEDEDEKEPSYVGAHLRRQLSFDLWYVFLGLFIISIVEGGRLENTNEYAFTLFSVLFEIVSAYGTVGLSLGYPNINASFSAEFQTLSKLIIIAMQIRGRHRGLPYELDRAILLPSESLHAKEAKEAERMKRRRSSGGMSLMSAVDGQIDGDRFRQETGLSTGYSPGSPRERSNTNRTFNSRESMPGAESHHSGFARHGVGSAMYKLASTQDAIREEIGHE